MTAKMNVDQQNRPRSLILVQRILGVIVSIQAVTFTLFLIERIYAATCPVVQSDETTYLYSAAGLFQGWSFGTVQNPGRPLFSLPIIVLGKLLHLSFRYYNFTFFNAAFYLVIFALSIHSICRNLKIESVLKMGVFSFLLSFPLFFELSAIFMGDIAVSAYSIFFLAVALEFKMNPPSFFRQMLLGVASCLGFQTKPTFLCFGLSILGALVLSELFRFLSLRDTRQKTEFYRRALFATGGFAAGFLPIAALVFPRDFLQLINELYYNSTTNSFDISAANFDVYFKSLWFPHALFAGFPVFAAAFFCLSLLIAFVVLARSWSALTRPKMSELFLHLENGRFVAVWTFLVLWFFFSFVQHFKDTRETLFLFCLFPVAGLVVFQFVLESLAERTKKWVYGATLAFAICNLLSVAGWSRPVFLGNALDKSLDLRTREFFVNKPSLDGGSLSFQGTRALDILVAVDKHAGASRERTEIFIPNCSGVYNPTMFATVYDFSTRFPNALPGIGYHFHSELKIFHSTYRTGAFYEPGGIPKYFLHGQYIVVIKNDVNKCFQGNPEVQFYNNLITRKIIEQDPVYVDGLEHLQTLTSDYGQTIEIYFRSAPVKPENFIKMVREITELDPANLWNLPYLLVASKLAPRDDYYTQKAREIRELSEAGKFSYKYWVTPVGKEYIERLLSKKNFPEDIEFPGFLNRIGY